jgi:hypothetical protein
VNKELDDDLHELLDQLDEPGDEYNLMSSEDTQTIEANQEGQENRDIISSETTETNQNSILDLDRFRNQLEIVTDEVLDACRADRQETQDVINLLRSKIDNASGDPPRMYVDGLVKAVEVKSNINQTAVKIIEANAKAIASLKPNIGNQNNIQLNAGVDIQLEELLQKPIDEDDV